MYRQDILRGISKDTVEIVHIISGPCIQIYFYTTSKTQGLLYSRVHVRIRHPQLSSDRDLRNRCQLASPPFVTNTR